VECRYAAINLTTVAIKLPLQPIPVFQFISNWFFYLTFFRFNWMNVTLDSIVIQAERKRLNFWRQISISSPGVWMKGKWGWLATNRNCRQQKLGVKEDVCIETGLVSGVLTRWQRRAAPRDSGDTATRRLKRNRPANDSTSLANICRRLLVSFYWPSGLFLRCINELCFIMLISSIQIKLQPYFTQRKKKGEEEKKQEKEW